jgi:hypothetical protein
MTAVICSASACLSCRFAVSRTTEQHTAHKHTHTHTHTHFSQCQIKWLIKLHTFGFAHAGAAVYPLILGVLSTLLVIFGVLHLDLPR